MVRSGLAVYFHLSIRDMEAEEAARRVTEPVNHLPLRIRDHGEDTLARQGRSKIANRELVILNCHANNMAATTLRLRNGSGIQRSIRPTPESSGNRALPHHRFIQRKYHLQLPLGKRSRKQVRA